MIIIVLLLMAIFALMFLNSLTAGVNTLTGIVNGAAKQIEDPNSTLAKIGRSAPIRYSLLAIRIAIGTILLLFVLAATFAHAELIVTPRNGDAAHDLALSYNTYIAVKACSRPGYSIGYLSGDEMETARGYMRQIEDKLGPLVSNKNELWKYASDHLDVMKKTVEIWSDRAASLASGSGYTAIHDKCLRYVGALRETAQSLGVDTTEPKDF